MNKELLLNDFAVRCFRDVADADYVTARMAFRASLIMQFLWSSQQAIEKYLKCILLLNRIPAVQVLHDLQAALDKIQNSEILLLDLTDGTKEFIHFIDAYGRFRYLETSPAVFGFHLLQLDRTIWEIRRYCSLSEQGRQINLKNGEPAEIVRIPGGFLEEIVSKKNHPARQPLLWHNAFFGKRRRRKVGVRRGFHAINSPLFLNPEILEEVSQYVHLSKDVKAAYRKLREHGDPRLK